MIFSPPDAPAGWSPDDLDPLAAMMRGKRTVIVSGAGCSTESGIPDYRGPQTRQRARNPIQYLEFARSPEARRRYWARSAVGWPSVRDAAPNAAHRAVARLERAGLVGGVITQNVDRLHQKGGAERVIELHGALAEVRCLGCGEREHRDALQRRIEALNPKLSAPRAAEIAPDGDAEIGDDSSFRVPSCRRCQDGVLKPDVVFFGENVPKPRVERAFGLVEEADALLVLGSSLAIHSGLRFVKRAARRPIPIAIVNLDETRGDPMADLIVRARLGDALPELAKKLGAS